MSEMHLIKEMEEALGLPLIKMEESRIDPPREPIKKQKLIRGYSINQDKKITGLRLEKLNLEPVQALLQKFRHITLLNLNDTWLSQWDFLQEWKSVKQINLNKTKFSDYTWLSTLPNIETICLGRNNISDASFLRKLKKLSSLDLCNNNISDAFFLYELKKLSSLYLRNNKITDLKFLTEFKQLTSFSLSGNNITDLSFLRELKNLSSLYLTGTNITNPSFLKNLKNLSILYLKNNNISDTTFLKELGSLTSFYFIGNNAIDISLLKNLKNLSILYLRRNNISDTTFLKELKNLSLLSFSGNNISETSFLRELKNLSSLDLSNNNISDTSFLKELKNLSSLDLSNNNISDTSFLKELKNLSLLSLSGNNISDTSFLRELKNLSLLSLSGNNISDTSFLKELKNLSSLYLSGNNISDTSFLKELKNLSSLNLRRNNISDTSFLRKLKNLSSLYLSVNNISDTSFIKELRNLTYLSLRRNNISDTSSIKELKNLTALSISGNNISDTSSIKELKNLSYLDLRDNKISDISFLKDLPKVDDLSIDKNFIKEPSPDIIQQGPVAIRDYFLSLEGKIKKKALNEIKVLLIGDGGAGKTSLLKRIQKEPFNKDESKTHGINIALVPFNLKNSEGKRRKVTGRFWDFGGQEIMHASHQFFLSTRSLYVLVLDSRKEEKVEYWLKHIQTYGGDSPVLIVINKIDLHHYDVDRGGLLKKYKNIKGFFPLSCADGKGVNEFRKALLEEIPKTEFMNTLFADTWLKVKTGLEKKLAGDIHYLNDKTFQDICTKEKIDSESMQGTLIEFLNQLGVILHFHELHLMDFYVLDPRWVTEGVYKIINSRYIAEKQGFLPLRELDHVVNKEVLKEENYDLRLKVPYSGPEQRYLVDLMEQFKLCFSCPQKKLLFPDLLQQDTPDFDLEDMAKDQDSLKFRIDFDFMPRSIMAQFIIAMHEDIKQPLLWRNGVVLVNGDLKTCASVVADNVERQLAIEVAGENKRDYFTVIRTSLLKIFGVFKRLERKELILLPGHPEVAVEYAELIGLKQKGDKVYPSGKLKKDFPLDLLLGMYTTPKKLEKELSGMHRDINVYTKEFKMGNNYYQGDHLEGDHNTKIDKSTGNHIMNIGQPSISPEEWKKQVMELIPQARDEIKNLPEEQKEEAEKKLNYVQVEAESKNPDKGMLKGVKPILQGIAGSLIATGITALPKLVELIGQFIGG